MYETLASVPTRQTRIVGPTPMNWVMCRECGEFNTARETDVAVRPISDHCRQCDGTSFKHVASDTDIETA
jgi:hypothetical protein